jgi:hypothetical protein
MLRAAEQKCGQQILLTIHAARPCRRIIPRQKDIVDPDQRPTREARTRRPASHLRAPPSPVSDPTPAPTTGARPRRNRRRHHGAAPGRSRRSGCATEIDDRAAREQSREPRADLPVRRRVATPQSGHVHQRFDRPHQSSRYGRPGAGSWRALPRAHSSRSQASWIVCSYYALSAASRASTAASTGESFQPHRARSSTGYSGIRSGRDRCSGSRPPRNARSARACHLIASQDIRPDSPPSRRPQTTTSPGATGCSRPIQPTEATTAGWT